MGWIEDSIPGQILNTATLGAAGVFAGQTPEERQNQRLNNEFRQVDASGRLASMDRDRQMRANQLFADSMNGPQAAGAQAQGPGQLNPFVNQLMAQFGGNGPGQEIARRRATEQANAGIQQQLSQAASGRGGASPLAARMAAQNSAGISAGAANAATMGGLMAQQQAANPLLGALGQQNQLGQFNAGLRQGNQQFNVNAQLQNRQQREQAALELLRQQLAGQQTIEQQRGQRFASIAGTELAPNRTDQLLAIGTGLAQTAAKGVGK